MFNVIKIMFLNVFDLYFFEILNIFRIHLIRKYIWNKMC